MDAIRKIISDAEVAGAKDGSDWKFEIRITDEIMKLIVTQATTIANFVIQANTELCQKMKTKVNFNVQMADGSWHMNTIFMTNDKSDCSSIGFKISAMTYLLLLSGKISGPEAFLGGAIAFEGSMNLQAALRMQEALGETLAALENGTLLEDLSARL